jgi:ribose 5-phosphate isomerase B
MKIAVGSDERTCLTDWVVQELESSGTNVELHGALMPGGDSRWPDVARVVGEEVSSGRCQQGILFCWTGTGVSIGANKVPGVRAALCGDAETARGARLWNDANVLCMSLRLTSRQVAQEILDAWCATTGIDENERENIELVNRIDRQERWSKGSMVSESRR